MLILACSGTCESGWTTIGCFCYKFQATGKTWDDAKTDCAALKSTGKLVSITSESLELALITMANKKEFWTGGNDKAVQETFVWDADGTEFFKGGNGIGYNKWWATTAVSQPNHGNGQDCVKLKVKLSSTTGDLEKYGWDDVSCTNSPIPYICQYNL